MAEEDVDDPLVQPWSGGIHGRALQAAVCMTTRFVIVSFSKNMGKKYQLRDGSHYILDGSGFSIG